MIVGSDSGSGQSVVVGVVGDYLLSYVVCEIVNLLGGKIVLYIIGTRWIAGTCVQLIWGLTVFFPFSKLFYFYAAQD